MSVSSRKMDEVTKNGIIAIVAMGCSLETAAKYFKYPLEKIYREIEKNKEFAQSINQAEEQAEIFFMRQIKNAALEIKNWRAATWSLERLYPNRYGKLKADSLNLQEVQRIFERLVQIFMNEISSNEDKIKIEEKLKKMMKRTMLGNGIIMSFKKKK